MPLREPLQRYGPDLPCCTWLYWRRCGSIDSLTLRRPILRRNARQLTKQSGGAGMGLARCAVKAYSAGLAHGGVQRREAAPVLGIQPGAMIGQELNYLVIAFERRPVQCRLPAAVDCVDVCPGLQRNLDCFDVFALGLVA